MEALGLFVRFLLAAALAAQLAWLLDRREGRGFLGNWLRLFIGCAALLAWTLPGGLGGPASAGLALFGVLWFAFAFESSLGAVFGAVGAGLGASASWWLELFAAIGRVGQGFAGPFFAALLPLFLTLSCALAALALLKPEVRQARGRLLALLLLAWSASAALADWRLRSAWDYGPVSLAQAAGVAASDKSAVESLAALRPKGVKPYEVSQRRKAVGQVDAAAESLERVDRYLKERGYRSLFLNEGLQAARQGRLRAFDCEKALEAFSLAVPGRVVPDYLSALGLLRAGPMTPERYGRLDALASVALHGKGGFEDVNKSQRIFEAFSGAYARFGDEERARFWLLRIDDLWPIYEKKIEASPIEIMRDGEISGRLTLDGRPASGILVGLFLESTSEVTKKTVFDLSSGVYPDSDGVFHFRTLASGRYHLELLGSPEQLPVSAVIDGNPGLILLSESHPLEQLPTIAVVRRLPGMQPLPGPPSETALPRAEPGRFRVLPR